MCVLPHWSQAWLPQVEPWTRIRVKVDDTKQPWLLVANSPTASTCACRLTYSSCQLCSRERQCCIMSILATGNAHATGHFPVACCRAAQRAEPFPPPSENPAAMRLFSIAGIVGKLLMSIWKMSAGPTCHLVCVTAFFRDISAMSKSGVAYLRPNHQSLEIPMPGRSAMEL